MGAEYNIEIKRWNEVLKQGISENLKSADMRFFVVYAAHDYQYNIYQLSKYLLGIFEGIIKDDKYPFLYQEGVFKSFGENDEKPTILPHEAFEACINKLKMEIKEV